MTTDIELTRSLHQAADGTAVPPVDVDVLRTGGRRLVRRRRAAVMGAAALVVALVGGGTLVVPGLLGSDSGPGPVKRDDALPPHGPRNPRTVADLPTGPVPRLPYVRGRVLHVGSSATELPGSGLAGLRYGGGVTLGWDADRGVVEVGPRGDLRLLDPDATGYPAVSPDGRWAAWPVLAEGQDARVVIWSFETGRAAGGFSVPERPQCCDSGFRVAGVGNDGAVIVSGDRAHYVVDGADRTVRVVEGLDPSSDTVVVSADAVVVVSAPGAKEAGGRARLGEIVAGRLRSTIDHTGPEVASSWWSPYNAGLEVSRRPAGGIQVFELDGGPYSAPERVAVPSRADVNEVAWESADAMLVQVTEGQHGWWLRCSVGTGACERAADLGDGGGDTVILPRR